MQLSVIRSFVLVGVMIVWPALVYAQEATVSGIVTDVTGAVLPGVTVTVVHEASGNVFTAVTDAQGGYRLPARAGLCRVTADLSGFAGVAQGLEILVGQQLVVNLRMAPSTVQGVGDGDRRSTAHRRRPLRAGTNIDTRQMSDLPVNGRNWMDRTMLAAGSRINAVAEDPGANGTYQINVDGIGTQGRAFRSAARIRVRVLANGARRRWGRTCGRRPPAVRTPPADQPSIFQDELRRSIDFIVSYCGCSSGADSAAAGCSTGSSRSKTGNHEHCGRDTTQARATGPERVRSGDAGIYWNPKVMRTGPIIRSVPPSTP